MALETKKNELRLKRKKRVRSRVYGTTERPRLSVFRSPRHVFAQVINDETGQTIASVSSFAAKGTGTRANKDKCTELGKALAAKCKEKSVGSVVFDKNGYAYHGRIKALADGAREGGLSF